MASALQKLLRKPTPLPFKFITASIPSSNLQNPIPTLPPHYHLQPSSTPPVMKHLDASTVIFPSFPFGFSPKPGFESGFPSLDGGVEESSGTLWADSVKKKRKRKMNKHKYQKLRKRMRRQS